LTGESIKQMSLSSGFAHTPVFAAVSVFLRWHGSGFKSHLATLVGGVAPNHNRYRIMNMLMSKVLLADTLMH